jgi:hypothetical protein
MVSGMSELATFTYLGPSGLTDDGGLRLQTSGGAAPHPRFFTGFVMAAEPVAVGLLAVAEVARTRYHQPIDARSLDPVVTGSPGHLRFESFSGCCGVAARMDVLPGALDGEPVGHGTTNVDVNAPLRAALGRVRGSSALRMEVGPDELAVTTMHASVVEKRVPLPARWLRGFAEVQVIASRFDPHLSVTSAQATAFLRRLPRGTDRSVLWVVPSGRSLRLTSRPVPGAVCLPGAGRLVALRPLLRFATGLRAYGPPVGPSSGPVASTWELQLPGVLRLSLTLSPEPSRGFSGEGSVLAALATDEAIADADTISPLLPSAPTVDVDALATVSGLPAARVRAALTQLGTAGRVGFDVAQAAYFHRVLPYDASAAAKLNPRLLGARRLVDEGAVELGADTAWVRSGDERYQVRVSGEAPVSCTCPWWARYRGGRGPCKHALAVGIAAEGVSA